MIYYRFQLDTSSEENRKKINPTKARALENMLKKEQFSVLNSSIGTNGTPDSLLVSINTPHNFLNLECFNRIISDLDLPYVWKESYSPL